MLETPGVVSNRSHIGYFPSEPVPYGEWIMVDRLAVWRHNPKCRMGNDRAFRELWELLRRHGQVEPATVRAEDSGLIVLDGNRRLRAARELGWSHLWCLQRPDVSDPTAFAAVRNSAQKSWGTQEVVQVVVEKPEITQIVVSSKAQKIALLRQLLGEDYPAFSDRYGLRAFDVARRTAAYLGWPDDRTAQILRYFLSQDTGIIRRVEEAIRWGIATNRLAMAIDRHQPLIPRWS